MHTSDIYISLICKNGFKVEGLLTNNPEKLNHLAMFEPNEPIRA